MFSSSSSSKNSSSYVSIGSSSSVDGMFSNMNSSSSLSRWWPSSGRWVIGMASMRLESSVIAFQRASFSSVRPSPVTEDMKTEGRSAGRVGRISAFSSSSSISLLDMAKTRCLSMSCGLKRRSSSSRISYCRVMSSASAGTMKSRTALRSMCRRNRRPRPRPSLAPSMMPGISAMTNVRLPRYSTMPS